MDVIHLQTRKRNLPWLLEHLDWWSTSSGTISEAHSGKLLAIPSHAQQC